MTALTLSRLANHHRHTEALHTLAAAWGWKISAKILFRPSRFLQSLVALFEFTLKEDSGSLDLFSITNDLGLAP
jgi:hypothetical protein